jgi:aspartokinase
LKVQNIEIRTDVDGIFSADPRIIKDSKVWPEVDYTICAELALA